MIGLKDRGRFDLWLQRRNECFVVQKEKESRMKQRDDRLFILQGLLCPEWGASSNCPLAGSSEKNWIQAQSLSRTGLRPVGQKMRHQIHCRWISLHGSVEVGVGHVVSADTQAPIHLRYANQRL